MELRTMPTVRDVLSEARPRLSGDDARREAELLLARVLGVGDAWLIAHAEDPLSPANAAAFDALIERCAAGEPVAYLIGTRGFHAIELHVTPDVLIPRPETELLVDLALARIPVGAHCTVADLGTGSGAVALAIAHARPRTRVTATDVSASALAVARANAQRLGLPNVAFARGNWCAALGDAHFDLIVSNPPYVASADPHLREGDLRFEPRAALASGLDGLDAIRTIVRETPAHVCERGWLLFEHGFDQGAQARDLLAGFGYTGVFTKPDLAGRERVSGGRIK